MNLYQTLGDLTCVKFLGNGCFGEVFLYQQNKTNNIYAVKMIDKSRAKHSKNYKYLVSELQILKKLNHPNIAKLIKVIDNETQIHLLLVMEYCNGGSLLECLEKFKLKYNMPFTEEIVQYLTRQIVDALVYIHGNNIIHRDLKSENIMVHFDNNNDKIKLNMMKAKIKIIDFGLSKVLSSTNGFATSLVGTPIYEDPKILQVQLNINKDIKNFQYSKEADIWSLGCICFEMIKGDKIFEASSYHSLINKIEKGNYKLPQSVSREFISFLYSMLQFDGTKRLSAIELLKKSFLRKSIKEFHYLSVNHDLKQQKEFLELKSSINLYKEKMQIQKSYKKQISSGNVRPNPTLNMPNLNQNKKNIINSAPNPNQPYNLQYNIYGIKMTPGDEANVSSTNPSSSYPSNFSNPNSMSLPSYQSSLAHSYGPNSNITQQQPRYQSMMNNNNFNLNNNSANSSYQQSNNNSSINTSFQRYNSQQFDKDKDDDLCIVF